MASRTLKDYTNHQLVAELLNRNGAALICLRQKTNIQKQKYVVGASGSPEELSILMIMASDHVITRFDEEEEDGDEEDLAH
jgi:hypothetical protein